MLCSHHTSSSSSHSNLSCFPFQLTSARFQQQWRAERSFSISFSLLASLAFTRSPMLSTETSSKQNERKINFSDYSDNCLWLTFVIRLLVVLLNELFSSSFDSMSRFQLGFQSGNWISRRGIWLHLDETRRKWKKFFVGHSGTSLMNNVNQLMELFPKVLISLQRISNYSKM